MSCVLDTFLINEIQQLKGEGYDYGQIRRQLNNANYGDSAITAAFRQVDRQEIHALYQQQRLVKLRTSVIISLVVAAIGLAYMFYQYANWSTVDLVLLLPIGFLLGAYYEYRRVKSTHFSTRKIEQEEKRQRHWTRHW